MMDRKQLIEEAAKALTGLTDAEWDIATAEGTDHLTGYFEAADRVLAVFEGAYTPTDDEREALSEFLFTVYEHGSQPNALREADAILAFLRSRRTVQGEPCEMCRWERGFGARKPLEHTCEKGAETV